MTAPYTWRCGCGLEGRGEDNAREHANSGCEKFGYPITWDASREWVPGHWEAP